MAPNELAWPFADVAPAEGGCVDVDGDRTAVLTAELADATQITVWTDRPGARGSSRSGPCPGEVRCRP
ncbi:MAG: hypothetical protein Q8K58_07490 [Acidimicrobiales bacterium]|nr:hypothetical protein [Acidimicrobiales bacterium]